MTRIAIALAAAIGIASPAAAARGDAGYPPMPTPKPVVVETDEPADPCSAIYEIAFKVMAARQVGYPMPSLMGAVEAMASKAIVVDAYVRPQFGSPEYQQRATLEFANEWYLACVQEFGQ